MKYFKIGSSVFIYLGIILTLISCRDLVQDQFPDIQKVVVNSIFTSQQEMILHVSFTAKMNDTIFQNIENASIKMYKDDQFVENLIYVGDGCYLSNDLLEENHKYSCEVTVPNQGTYYCSDFLPQKQNITNIKHVKIAGITDEGELYSSVTVNIENQGNERKYYQLIVKEVNEEGYSYVNLAQFTDPVLISEGLPILVFSNENFDGNSYEMTINYTATSFSNYQPIFKPIQVELRSISYHYYQYLKSIYIYQQGIYPDFDNIPTFSNIYSNIQGTYGIFAGYSYYLSDTIIP